MSASAVGSRFGKIRSVSDSEPPPQLLTPPVVLPCDGRGNRVPRFSFFVKD